MEKVRIFGRESKKSERQISDISEDLKDLLPRIRSKHVSIPLLSLSIACRRNIIIQNVPHIIDLVWLCRVAEMIGDTVRWRNDCLEYFPRHLVC